MSINIGPAVIKSEAYFGNGSDGDIFFDGVSEVCGIKPDNGVYTAKRNIHAKTVGGSPNVKLFMRDYKLYINSSIVVKSVENSLHGPIIVF